MNVLEAITEMKNGKTVGIKNDDLNYQFYYHKATKSIVLDCSHENTSCPNTHYNGADLYITNCDDFAENWNEFDFIII